MAEALPLPSPSPQTKGLSLLDLPDLIHEGIAACLTSQDLHRMTECSPWATATYLGHVRELVLHGEDLGQMWRVLGSHPGFVHLTVKSDTAMRVVSEAMAKGSHCDRLEALKVTSSEGAPVADILALLSTLAKGSCPHMTKLSLVLPMKPAEDSRIIRALGESLESRMNTGGEACKPLKSLELFEDPHQPPYLREPCPLSPLLSSASLEGLEELRIRCRLDDQAYRDLGEWLERQRAYPGPNTLRVLHLDRFTAHLSTALLQQWAPNLQVLSFADARPKAFRPLAQAMAGGLLPGLKELRIGVRSFVCDDPAFQQLVDAILGSGGGLRTLALEGTGVRAQDSRLMVGILSKGACPRLEELHLAYIHETGVLDLIKAWERGAPCNTTLRRLDLCPCGIGPNGMSRLVAALARGVLPRLTHLSLRRGAYLEDREMEQLADALGRGLLPRLEEIHLCKNRFASVGGRALCRALATGACPWLRVVCLGKDKFQVEVQGELRALVAGRVALHFQ